MRNHRGTLDRVRFSAGPDARRVHRVAAATVARRPRDWRRRRQRQKSTLPIPSSAGQCAGHGGERGTRDWTSTWHFQWLVRCRPHADWDGGMMADMYRRLPENSLLFNRANDIYVSASPFVALSWI